MSSDTNEYDICVIKLVGGPNSVMFSIPRSALLVDKRTVIADGIALFSSNKDSQFYIEVDVGDALNLDRLGVRIRNLASSSPEKNELLNFVVPPVAVASNRKYNLED
jgi:hypothetical protein